MKQRLARAAYGAELFLERAVGGDRPDVPVIEPYLGYSTPDGLVARGRVLSALRRRAPNPEQNRWANLRQMASLFLTGEVAGVGVEVPGIGASAVSDSEGYFSLALPGRPDKPGWIEIPVQTANGARAQLPVLVSDPEAEFGVISDIDDTVLETGAYSLARNLWTTFTGSALTRRVFPDSVALLERLHAGRNPVFYVSSSPWNLHHFLETVFRRAGVVRGPKFLRDLGLSADGAGPASHGTHKGAAIDTILAANPGLGFVLMGDTGQHDAEIYAAAAKRHPGRVRGVILRAPGPGADEGDKAHAREIEAMGIPVQIQPEFEAIEVPG